LLDKSVVTSADTMFKQINQADSKKTTPLILSVTKGYTHVNEGTGKNHQGQIIDRLLELGADVNLQEQSGFSALHYACLHQNVELIASLLRHGANPFLMNLKGETPLELLNKSRDERSDLLRSACQIFTLEQDNPNNKHEIEALLRSKMGEIAGESTRELDLSTANKKRPLSTAQEPIGTSSLNVAADLPAKTQQIVRPPKNPTPRVTQMKRSSWHTANSIKPSAQSAPETSIGAHSSSKEKSNIVIRKNNATFLMRFLASPLTKSALVLLVLSTAVFGLIGGGFLIGVGAIACSATLLLTSVGLFAGGSYKAVSQTDKKDLDNTISNCCL
jgi:hypothetical protein